MLQQTTVGAVLKRYEAFLRRFPDVRSLARSSEDDVLAAWSGLGYYARARNLARAARSIVADHGGAIPRDPAALRRLPGFGDYMARAVASLAYGARLPAAEANVERVLSRVFGLPGTAGSPALRAAVLSRAETLLPANKAGDFTAALMDLGQLVCTPRRPSCLACPIARVCTARRLGTPERFPRRRARPRPVRLALAAAVAKKDGRFLLVRRRSTWLDGMWEFPSAEGSTPRKARRALAIALRGVDLELPRSSPIGRARHTVVNRRIEVEIFRAVESGAGARPRRNARWFRPREIAAAAIPTLTRKVAAAALGSGRPFGLIEPSRHKGMPDPG